MRRRASVALTRGFTLIELIVVTAIIVVVTTVVLANNTRFGGTVQLQNLAYDIALSIRQAQVYGISVQRYGTGYTAGYGMHFSIADPTHYELFGDAAGTGLYDASENVPPSPYAIVNGYSITKLCAPGGADAASCTAVEVIDIVFKRPEPDAWISSGPIGNVPSCVALTNNCRASARIVLTAPKGDTLSVVVEANGQIAVKH